VSSVEKKRKREKRNIRNGMKNEVFTLFVCYELKTAFFFFFPLAKNGANYFLIFPETFVRRMEEEEEEDRMNNKMCFLP
jgi:hypothetical protein